MVAIFSKLRAYGIFVAAAVMLPLDGRFPVNLIETTGPRHDVVASSAAPSGVSLSLDEVDCWRSTGCDLAAGGDVDGGEAGSAASEDSNPARAL